ncbi:peptidyl-prolyl cis-trans isomerase [Kiritimatiellota bacterium B12222]|nr:peptidyl-prolyl cis-trans isomerase [Kiritimatiellota bacterium B12222]
MMIMRFHKLIQSRLLWLLFLGILIMTFVGWGVASSIGGDPALARLEQPVVIIDGKDVTFIKYDTTRRLLMQEYQQQMTEAQLEELTFNHLAMVAYAEKNGVDVPIEFAREQYKANFQTEAQLEEFRKSMRNSHMGEADYIRFIQEQLMIQSLQRMLASNVIVPAFDVERWAGTETDTYTIQYTTVTPQVLTDEVVVTDEIAESFFNENKERFMLPEERKIRYLTVSSENYTDLIKDLDDTDALAYYNSRPELYVRSVKQPASEAGAPETTLQEPIPFTEVKEQILENLKMEQAKQLAEDTAMSYAVRMTPRRGKPGQSLDEIASEAGLEVKESPAFSLYGPLADFENPMAIKQAAFKLDMSEYGKLGGPVTSGDNFIVIELSEIIAPRLPEFSEVRNQVNTGANMMLTIEALALKAEEIAAEIKADVKAGGDFETLVKKYDLSVISPAPYEMRNVDPRNPRIPLQLIQQISGVQTGDVVGPIETNFGTPVIGYLKARSPQPEQAAELTPQVRQMLSSRIYYPEVFASFLEKEIEPMIQTIEPENTEKESLIDDMAEAGEEEDTAS